MCVCVRRPRLNRDHYHNTNNNVINTINNINNINNNINKT